MLVVWKHRWTIWQWIMYVKLSYFLTLYAMLWWMYCSFFNTIQDPSIIQPPRIMCRWSSRNMLLWSMCSLSRTTWIKRTWSSHRCTSHTNHDLKTINIIHNIQHKHCVLCSALRCAVRVHSHCIPLHSFIILIIISVFYWSSNECHLLLIKNSSGYHN